MIYTIGHRESYLANIARYGTIHKRGLFVGEDGKLYLGGIVFRTREDAAQFIERHPDHGWAVFGLLADWDVDTALYDIDEWHRLLHDAEIVVLPEMGP